MAIKKILIVITSHDSLGGTGHKTGVWLEELAVPYYAFVQANFELTLASPHGGKPPIDPNSLQDDVQTDETRQFIQDANAQAAFANTKKLTGINANDFDAVFYPGGHGPLWDLATDKNSINLIEQFWQAQKPIAAVCHASIVLSDAKDAQGESIVKGKNVTGFTNAEEAVVGLTDAVPMLVEDTLKQRGASFSSADAFQAHAIKSGVLITGQNPASSLDVAKLLIEALG